MAAFSRFCLSARICFSISSASPRVSTRISSGSLSGFFGALLIWSLMRSATTLKPELPLAPSVKTLGERSYLRLRT